MMQRSGSLRKLKTFSQRFLRPNSPAEDNEASSSSFKLSRRNSVTEFNLEGQLPVYDTDPDNDDDESIIDVTHVKSRRTVILIQRPSSTRILDMELPTPPQKPPLHKPSCSSKTLPRLLVERAESERNVVVNHSGATMPTPIAWSRRGLSRSDSHRSMERRNSITEFNLDGMSKEESTRKHQPQIMCTQTQSHRDKRTVIQYVSPTKSQSHRHNRCVDRKATLNRKLACVEMSGHIHTLTASKYMR